MDDEFEKRLLDIITAGNQEMYQKLPSMRHRHDMAKTLLEEYRRIKPTLQEQARASANKDNNKNEVAAYDTGYRKGQADLHNRLIERISSWGIESSNREVPVLRRVMEIIDKEACATVRETPDDTHPLHKQGKDDAALTVSSESAGKKGR